MDYLVYFYSYIYLIILFKLSFIFFLILYFYYKFKSKQHPENITYKKNLVINENIKNQLGKIFTFLMSILLIILFNPRNNKQHLISLITNNKTQYLLFIYGFILLFTIDWSTFIPISNTIKNFI
jgi:hypothetical protein